MSIELRKVDKVTEIVAVNGLTASVTVLPNSIAPLEELIEGFEHDEGKQQESDAES